MRLENVIRHDRFKDFPNQLQLPQELEKRVVDCVEKYSCKSCNLGEALRYLIYRIWNAFKAICGLSDWQKTKRILTPFMKQVADPYLDKIAQMRIKESKLSEEKLDPGSCRTKILGVFEDKLKRLIDRSLNDLVDMRKEPFYYQNNVLLVLNFRIVTAVYDLKNEVRYCWIEDRGDEDSKTFTAETAIDGALEGIRKDLEAVGRIPSFGALV